MKNVFSVTEPAVEVDPAFTTQQQAGAQPTAPNCNPRLPEPAPVALPSVIEDIARIAAPYSPFE